MEKFSKVLTVYSTGNDLEDCTFLAVVKMPDKAYVTGQYAAKLFDRKNLHELPEYVWKKTGKMIRPEEDLEFRDVPENLRKILEKSMYFDVGV